MADSEQPVEVISLSLDDYMLGHGQVRSDVLESLGTSKKGSFSTNFELVHELHGSYEKGETDTGSLLAIKIIPKPTDLKRQFVWFKVTLTVLHGTDNPSNDEFNVPSIGSYEPASDGAQYASVTTTNETREQMFKGSLTGQVSGASPGIEGSRTAKSEYQKRHLLQVRSGVQRTISSMSRKKANQVWWEIQAANKEEGIGDNFTVALLINRPKESNFRVEAEIDGEVGEFSEIAKSLIPKGLRSKKDPTVFKTFSPARSKPTSRVPPGIDLEDMHAASVDDLMKSIAWVGLHLPEAVQPVRFLKDPKPEETTSPGSIDTSDAGLPPQTAPPVVANATAYHDLQQANYPSQPEVQLESQPRIAATGGPHHMGRAARHKKMAALYELLAELHREEARECLTLEEGEIAEWARNSLSSRM
ncbi:ankyrin unc44 [Fusarium bulbicola]|nr:ankyrin unc44 [Fusarium bulbicola]